MREKNDLQRELVRISICTALALILWFLFLPISISVLGYLFPIYFEEQNFRIFLVILLGTVWVGGFILIVQVFYKIIAKKIDNKLNSIAKIINGRVIFASDEMPPRYLLQKLFVFRAKNKPPLLPKLNKKLNLKYLKLDKENITLWLLPKMSSRHGFDVGYSFQWVMRVPKDLNFSVCRKNYLLVPGVWHAVIYDQTIAEINGFQYYYHSDGDLATAKKVYLNTLGDSLFVFSCFDGYCVLETDLSCDPVASLKLLQELRKTFAR